MREDYFLYYEEVDWAMRRGSRPLRYCEGLRIYHRAGTAIGLADAQPHRVAVLALFQASRPVAVPATIPSLEAADSLGLHAGLRGAGGAAVPRPAEARAVLAGAFGLGPPPGRARPGSAPTRRRGVRFSVLEPDLTAAGPGAHATAIPCTQGGRGQPYLGCASAGCPVADLRRQPHPPDDGNKLGATTRRQAEHLRDQRETFD